jgi:Sulfotransferase domain
MSDNVSRRGYEPFPVARRKLTWLNAVDGSLRARLPRPAYLSALAGYHGVRRLARRNPGRGRMLPDFVIIGAAKAGTTSVYAWLCEHPYVARARAKEIHYFSFYHYRGADWYRYHFPPERERASFAAEHGRPFITGEGSPTYLPDSDAPRRMGKLNPDVKLIVSLRDPVDRAYSQFQMRRRDGFEPVESFFTAAALEDGRVDGGHARTLAAQANHSHLKTGRTYLERSRYAEQLARWLNYFPREQLHVLTIEEMAADPQGCLDALHDFLGLPGHRPEHLEPQFRTQYDPLPEETRALLTGYFRPFNERLYELLGSDFGWER